MLDSPTMIKLSSYHNHCTYDDGRDSIQMMIEAARDQGFVALGFSSHSPLPWHAPWTLKLEDLSSYVHELRAAQQNYSDIEVFVGLELDYFGDCYNVNNWHPQPPQFDFLIGSVHGFIIEDRLVSVDGDPDELRQLARYFGGAKELVQQYFKHVGEMAELGGVDFLAHFDLVKKNFGRILTPGIDFEKQSWYEDSVFSCLERIARCGMRLELSTALISRSNRDELYPSRWLLPHLQRLGIPLVINSDAHATSHLGVYHREAAQLLKEFGYQSVDMLLDQRWQKVSI